MFTLNGNTRLVAMQFSFSNVDLIPPSVKGLSQRPIKESAERTPGEVLIDATEKCSLTKFLEELEGVGYALVDASYKENLDRKDPEGRRKYYIVRFVFARESAELSEAFKNVRENLFGELRDLCETALWKIRVFSNPYYKDHEHIPGERALSINMAGRCPLFQGNGQPVTAWQRDGTGKRMGANPIPISASYHLRVQQNAVCLVTA